MKKHLTEETLIFVSILRWFLIATLLGTLVGVANAVFLKLLNLTVGFTSSYRYYFVALPLVFLGLGYFSKKIFPKDRDYSTDDVVERINNCQKISSASGFKAFLFPIITIGAGGSAGKEAPCADMGASIGSELAQFLNFDSQDRRKLMICGVSAGFAGVFGVPISGALFGLEVLFVGKMFYDVMFPALVAGITAFQVTKALGVAYHYHPIDLMYVFSQQFFLKVILAGIFFGLCSFILIEFTKYAKILTRFVSMKFSNKIAPFAGGVLIVLVGLLISPSYLGLGTNEINSALLGNPVAGYGFLLKTVVTGLTFVCGGVGGIITPILFIGSYAGSAFANFLGLDLATFAAIGLVSVLAGACNTPIAASIMAIELFGAQIAPYATLSCIISFLMTGHRSVFPSQILSFKKESQIEVGLGRKLGTTKARGKKHAMGKMFKKISDQFKPPFQELFTKEELKNYEEESKKSVKKRKR
jgi:H+/Cl- antiporter ClcA